MKSGLLFLSCRTRPFDLLAHSPNSAFPAGKLILRLMVAGELGTRWVCPSFQVDLSTIHNESEPAAFEHV